MRLLHTSDWHLGRFFHRAKIRTAVVGKDVVCSSACTTAFLGGRDPETAEPWRAKGATAQLGFHSFKIDWVDKEYTAQDMSMAIARTQRMTLAMADYMTEVGASLEFLRARQEGLFKEVQAGVQLHECDYCGQPTTAPGLCSFCRMWERGTPDVAHSLSPDPDLQFAHFESAGASDI